MNNTKPLVWLRAEVKSPPFSAAARIEAGMLLRRLQRGELLTMPQSRPMPSIGKGCHELRIVDDSATWRVIYHLHAEAVVVLHVFAKTTQQTPQEAIRLSQRRLRDFLDLVEKD
jgi:phage-related protein